MDAGMLALQFLDLGKHAVFIWSSYAVVAIVIAGLIAWLIVEGRKYQRQIAQLEARGTRRRSTQERADG
jgi:heme exporter protein D